ncbi:MAG: FeoB-associated Cys-rich membrane protein [Oscillibacter sp.]|nr:FeoB-associated Cys-rich membrane protein [Oscillibacter sp.]
MSFIDYLLTGAILLALTLAVRKCIRDHRNGKTCDGNCAQCGGKCGK